jgi:hypothetical protein
LKNNTIILFIPGLWALLRHAGNETLAEMPALQQLLKRCDSTSESSLESETLLLNRLGWSGGENDDVPVAALERLGSGSDSEGYWFRADPVNLQEDQNYLMMSYPSVLDLELEEARALTESINQHFAEDGWSLEVVDAQRWYLKLDKDPAIQTTPAWRAVGRDIFVLMPAGENSRQWHAWLMELQMLLFSHPVNEARIEQGKAPVSGLWLWGGGELPKLTSTSTLLRGDSSFMQGIAMQSACEIEVLPDELSKLCNDVEPGSEQLIMLEYARLALQSGSMEQGHAALKQLEDGVFKPLHGLLKSKMINSLTIIETPGHTINVSASGIRKWWRRKMLKV